MSTALPALLAGLIDDAAVFPPGNAPLPVAVGRHRVHRRAPYAALVGPLLVPAAEVDALRAQARSQPEEPLAVSLISRPGVDPAVVVGAVERLTGDAGCDVTGAELGWFSGWRDLAVGALPLTLEIPRGVDRDRALDDVAAAVDEVGRPAQAKFRTGATPTWAWPDEAELADFLCDGARLGLPFKLTGGLHHAVRAEHDGDPQHGLLNVLLAVHTAARGSGPSSVAAVLSQRDARPLADAVAALDDAEVRRVRSLLTASGCCEVTDPIGELDALGVIDLDDLAPDEETPS